MNIEDFFKAKPDNPVDVLIKELTENNIPENDNETDVIVDKILNIDKS